MLSSLATFLFGAPAATCESASNSSNEVNPEQAVCSDPCDNPSPGDVIEVTSSTPSVAGNSSNRGPVRASPNGKRGKNRRGKQQRNNQQQQQQQQQRKQQPASITKLLTPTGETPIDEDFDEDEWYIVEKEDEEDDSLPRSDSDEELSVVEVQQQPRASSTACHGQAASGSSRHRRQHINSHSLYSGPRPQQQRNHLQRSRVARPLSISTLSPPRSVPPSSLADLDNVSQSLYVASPSGSDHGQALGLGQGGNVLMEESWYVTPPPCFTSIGPINMETSPFENLLIEHPSMSVYRSIRSTQEGTESFVNLDLGVAAEAPQTELQEELPAELELEPEQAQVQVQARALHEQRPNSARFDRHAAAQLKQETLARQGQKSNNKKQHQQLCRSAIKRSNKVRDFQAKSHRPRRSEMQHCKLVSGANNNRKCCF
ncbi:ras-interacting protein RIP3 isoform X1 [Drosophila subobscura]|uniref:ras-interacting protein RIP3 isoform X1 n=1 Tax=Drosophila subobscura TaxID=7241 RepID=UPI00155A88D2|nr:ras-interacting protein RIP3 isoform X1 [Drosophila subobscura]XP_034658182.1 ras-interacting protein RIP3 isoform X1 [Drosophila subobscura]